MSRKIKAILALVLVAALMCTLFAACAKQQTSTTPSDTSTTTNQEKTDTPAKTEKPAKSEEPEQTSEPEQPEEIVEINYAFYDFSNTCSEHMDRIAAAVNAITEKEIGVHVNFRPCVPGEWAAKVGTAIAGGEVIDVMQLIPPIIPLGTLYASNQIVDITDLLPEYAPNAYEIMKNYFGNLTVDGKIMGLPAYRNLCSNGYLLMRKDILEELDLLDKAENMTTWSEYEQILQAVTDKYRDQGIYANTNGIANLMNGYYGDNFSDIQTPWLTDGLGVAGLMKDGQVHFIQGSDEYKAMAILMKDWRDKGYIYPDSLYTTVIQDDLFKQGVAFSGPQGAEYGVATTKSAAFGMEVIATQVRKGFISGAGWGVVFPTTGEETEAALRFMDLCFTSPEVMNLLTRGEEGTDYNLVDGQISFVEGPHYFQTATFFGNELISTPLLGNGADFYDKVKAIMNEADVSPYMGFSFNVSALDNYVSQLSVVMDQYKLMMNNGGYNEEDFQDFLTKLEAAGVNDYIAELQSQVDAWEATH